MKNVNDVHVHRYDNHAWTMMNESIAVESLVHLRVNDEHVSSLLASPGDLEDLLIGHMATEYGLAYQVQDRIKLSSNDEELFAHLHTERTPTIEARTAIVTSSCGACDQSNLSSLIQTMPSVPSPNKPVSLDVVIQALYDMRGHQKDFTATGGMHAAGLLINDEAPLLVREDIGRHNAVDKVYGLWCKGEGTPPVALLLSGRCGWDIVAKAASMGTPIIASFGAASSLAIEAARWTNITLVSFVRDGKAVVIGPVDGRFERKH